MNKYMYNFIPFLTPGAANNVIDIIKAFPEYKHIIIHNPDIIKDGLTNKKNMHNRLKKLGASILSLPIFKRRLYYFSYSLGGLAKIFKLKNPDIVFSHSAYSALIINLAKKILRKKFIHISIVHGWGINKTKLQRISDIFSLNHCDKIICVSNAIKNQMENYGVNSEKISIINYGIEKINGKIIDIHKEFNIPKNKLILFSASRLVIEKDPEYLLDIAGECRNLDIMFLIAGDGYMHEKLQKRIDSESLPVKLLGFRKDIPDLMESSDIFIMSSKYDALPFAVIEALSHGLPVLAPPVGGIPEMISHKSNGYLYNSKEEAKKYISLLINNKILLNEFGARSKEIYYSKFTPEIMKAKMERLIKGKKAE